MAKLRFSTSVLLAGLVTALSCGGGSPSSQNPTPTPPAGTVPQVDHVIIVVGENHGFDSVVGNASMPFFNSLIAKYSLAAQFYADTHPSLPNYFVLTAGDTITTTNTSDPVSNNNVASQLSGAGKSWKCYAESLPSGGVASNDSTDYVKHHIPFAYFKSVLDTPSEAARVVSFSQFASDLSNGTLPQYSFIVPNIHDDAHDCPPAIAACSEGQKLGDYDQWLASKIGPLLNSPAFQTSLLILTWDEGDQSDTTHGGGHIATVLVSPKVKAGFQSSQLYQHESLLRLSLRALGETSYPGKAASAPDMVEFFQ